MNITKDKVIAFFEDRCSKEEAEAIHRFLEENPQWLHEYFPEEEWINFQPTEDMEPERSQRIWEKIERHKTPLTARIRFVQVARVAAAVAVVAAGLWFLKQYAGNQPGRPASLTARVRVEKRDTLFANRTGKLQRLTLADGSMVSLYPSSMLRWTSGSDKRSVMLSGEALFSVTKDKHRPFAVFTKGFSTTVLGTVFQIKAYDKERLAAIQLLSGKVVVRNLSRPKEEAYLLPGQECVFDNHSNVLEKTKPVLAAKPVTAPEPEVNKLADSSSQETDTEILFKNLPLPRVLAILSASYHTPIHFTDADLDKRKFTGSIRKEQSVGDALNTIALLNDLSVVPQDSGYLITRQQ